MAKKVKITKDGQTVYPATVMDAVVHKDLRVDSSTLIEEVNVSKIFPTGGIDGTNKYTLETAIAKIPASLRNVGIKCSFLDEDGQVETWEYQGGTFTSVGEWGKVGIKRFLEYEALLYGKRKASVGKNKINLSNKIDGYFLTSKGDLTQNSSYCISNYMEIKPSTQYYISKTGVGGAYHVFYDEKLNVIGATKDGATTSPENAAYIKLSIDASKIDTAQMELGSAATAYEPYTDNYDNEQKFAQVEQKFELTKVEADNSYAGISVGKNLFNKATATKGYWIDQNGNLWANDNFYLSDYIAVEPNTQYCISNSSTGGASNVWFDENLEVIGTAEKSGATTSPENAAYIKLSIDASKIDTAQFEKGGSATSYEPYTDNYENEQKFEELQAELDETNTHLTEMEKKLPKTTMGKNLFDPDKVVSGFLNKNGIVVNNDVYVTSDFIAIEGGQTVTAHPLGTGQIHLCQYDSDKTFIVGTLNKQTLTVTLESNTAYIRATFLASNYATEGQIEYGSTATEYEHFRYVISEDSLPEGIGSGTTPEEVGELIDEEVFPAKLILPKKLYFMVGRQNNLYFKQAIKCPNYENFDFMVSNVSSGLKVFDRQLSGTPTLESSSDNKLTLRKFGKLLQELQVTFNTVIAPSSAKTVKILDTGDSISDLGGWQVALKELLASHNVTVKYIGTMINRVNIGSSSSSNYVEDIWGEVQSGGNMSFITEYGGAAKILTVSNITELPKTGYPGTAYLDSNNNSWVVRGFKLTRGSDGKYSGKLKLGKFRADPNYGDGATDDSSEAGNFPASGTITKTDSENGSTLEGDETIAYTSFDDARFNPFWNPTTDELDFQYYFDYWGFEIPDIFIMQWGYNEVNLFDEIDGERVELAKTRAKTIVDKFHAQYPNTKIIFGLEIYGREAVTYSGNYNNNSNGKKYSILSFAEKLISLFENNDDSGTPYSNYVTLVPLYALMDHIYGYGPLTEISLCDLYSNAKTTVGQNGKDGVHPSYSDGGLRELGRAYEPVILSLIE